MFNTMFDVAFTVMHECPDPDDVPLQDLIIGLERRLDYLKSNLSEVREAIGVCDTYELDAAGDKE
jgi:hypothetical protein